MRQNKPAWQKDNIPIILWGVLMSGRMNEERINKLFPAMLAKAEKKERVLEVLFHPGTVLQEELQEEFSNTGAMNFIFQKEGKSNIRQLCHCILRILYEN